MGDVVNIRGKTEQRVIAVIDFLKTAPSSAFTYEEISKATSSHYDACLYICATLVEVGLVTRHMVPEGPGRPKVRFQWAGKGKARELGSRSA